MSNRGLPLRIVFCTVTTLFAVALFTVIGNQADSAGGPSVVNPVAEGDSVYLVPTIANDLVYHPTDGKIYMSIPGTSGANGNSIQTVDPANGQLGQPVFAGSEPNKLAISETGHALYVSLDVQVKIKRFITSTMESDLEYQIGSNGSGAYRPADMAVPPGYWNILAVVRTNSNSSFPDGVAIFNNSVQAPQTTSVNTDDTDTLAFSDSASTLYGTGQYEGLTKILVDANGATTLQTSTLVSGRKIKFSQGKIFTSRCEVVDPNTNTILGQFDPTLNTPAFVADANGRAYYLARETSPADTFTVRAYDVNTFALIGTTTVSGLSGEPAKMIRWGANGLAVRMTNGQVYVIQTSLIPTPQPVATPSSTPTPTPTPIPVNSRVEEINIAGSGIAYNPANGGLYVSVPSSSATNGNTITVVDPVTASIQSTSFIGSEPSKVKLARDGSKLFVYLSGAREFRIFDVASNTPGEQFPVSLANEVLDFDTAPGLPNVIAVSAFNSAISIYDNGVVRPQIGGGGSSLAFADSASILYGGNSFYNLTKMTVTPAGIGGSTSINYILGNFVRFQDGLVYGSRGPVFDPATGLIKGSFPVSFLGDTARFIVLPEHNRILYLGQARRIYAYELDTFRPTGSIPVPGSGVITGFERIDTNGVAISQSNGPVLLIRSALIDPSLPVPTQTPTPTPTPIPNPTPDSTFFRRIDQQNNDMRYNTADGKLYVSVPGQVKDGTGNTITRIDPQTGQIVSSTFIGSEPTRLGLSENNQVLFTNLAGAGHVIRMFDTVNLTPGLQYPLTHVTGFSQGLSELEPVPGAPNSVVAATLSSGTAVYDNGLQRPNTIQAYSVEFSSTPGMLYGTNGNTELQRLSLNSEGLTRLNTINGLISGADLTFEEGKLYGASGRVVDPEAGRIFGTFQTQTPTNAIAVDVEQRKVFIAASGTISAYNMDTFLRLGTILVPGGTSNVTRLVRWGENGLAMRVGTSPSYIQILQSRLVSATGTIPTGISFNAAGQVVSEGNFGSNVIVNRTGDLSGTSIVNYATADGTASAGQDYIVTSGQLTFAPGESSKSFTVQIINDTIFENGAENFRIELTNPPGETAQLISPSVRTVTINDNEFAPVITPSDVTAAETRSGTSSTATVQVALSNRSVMPVSIAYSTASATATSGTDFVATSGILTFQPMENIKTFPVTLIGDNLVEGNETFKVNFSSPTNGSIFDLEAVVTIADYEPVDATLFDYDADGRADLSIRRPSDGLWYILRGTAGYMSIAFGEPGDLMVPADYDGDRKTDVAMFRPSTGQWFIFNSLSQTFVTFSWGANGDLPVPADHNGDGRADLVVFRESDGTWYRRLSNNSFSNVAFGVAGDKPVVGDFDGDSKYDIALYRPSDHNWYILKTGFGFFVQTWGEGADVPVPADYDGDGKTDVSVWRPSTGQWFRIQSTAGFGVVNWGQTGDLPIPADYDGDGKSDVAVFRPSTGTWFALGTTNGIIQQQFGQNGDLPTQSAFIY